MPYAVSTPTIADSPVAFSYVSSSSSFCLDLPFVPSAVQVWSSTNTWTWFRGLGFGQAIGSTTFISTAGVLDFVDGSGVASANIGTTTKVIGLVLGTSSIVNNGAALQYYGLAHR